MASRHSKPASAPPHWQADAIEALWDYKQQFGDSPTRARCGPAAVDWIEEFTGQRETLLGFPIELDEAIEAIAWE